MLRTIEIREVDQLQSYRLPWTSLWRGGRQPWFTQSLDWLAAYVSLQSDRVALRTLLISDDDELLGIVPLVLTTESTRHGPLRSLRYPLLEGIGCCGPIGTQPTFVLLEAMQYLMRHRDDWDVLDLAGIDVDGVDHGRTKTALHVAQIEAEVAAWQTRRIISLRTPEETKAIVARIDQHDRLPQRPASFEYVRYRPEGAMHGDAEPRLELFDDCDTIAAAGDRAAESHLMGNALLRELHEVAAKNGTLDVNLLYVDDAPAAFVYGYVCDDRLTVVDAGMDPRFAAELADQSLLGEMLEDSLARGDRTIDCGPKPVNWLKSWFNETQTIYRAQSVRPTGLIAQTLSWGKALRRRFGEATTQ